MGEAMSFRTEAETRVLAIKARALVTGLRAAMDDYDSSGPHPTCPAPCELCAAFAELRKLIEDGEQAVSDLERSLASPKPVDEVNA